MRTQAVTTHVALAAFSAALSIVLAAPLAHAQSDADRATARELGQEGQTALDAKDYKTAEDRFHRADSLFHAPTLLLGYARAEAALGKVVNANESYNRIIREGVSPGAPKVFVDALAAAKAEVAAVQARVANVTITITGPDTPTVTLDDSPVPNAALGVKRAIDPGQHVVKASADGWEPAQTTFTVPDAGTAAAALVLKKASGAPIAAAAGPAAAPAAAPVTTPPPAAGAPPPASSDVPASSDGSTQRTIGIVGMIVGGAGLATGVITGVLAMGKHSTLTGECKGGVCPPSASSDLSSYHSMGTISTIGFIGGAVLGGGGAILFFTAPHGSSAAPTTGTTLTPYIGLGSLGAVGTF
jgi:hypothetical protein